MILGRVALAVLAISQLSLETTSALAAGTWTPVQHLPGVVDVAGPRTDGRVVVSAGRQLYLLNRLSGELQPFATGAGGYPALPGDEPYLAISSGRSVHAAGCRFSPDDLFVIDQSPHQVWRVDASGHASVYAKVDGVDSLSGITFDNAGSFGNRLLVIGPSHGHSVVVAIDCQAQMVHLTDAAPTMEGGIVVAPATFGAFAGNLIAPDELSGLIRAVRPDGSTAVVADSGVPHGPDLGIEGFGFVPAGFSRGGSAYFADRSTPGNAHPGTGTLLAIDSATLSKAGVKDGDLVGATEGGARTIAVRCGATCRVSEVAQGPAVAHGEGHVLLVADHLQPSGTTLPPASHLGAAARNQSLLIWVGLGVLPLAGLLVLGIVLRRSRRRAA